MPVRLLAASIPAIVAPQLATLVDAPPNGAGWVYEIKLDGYRILASCETFRAESSRRSPLEHRLDMSWITL